MAFVIDDMQARRMGEAVVGIEAKIADAAELAEKAGALAAKSGAMLTVALRELEELYILFNNACSLDVNEIKK